LLPDANINCACQNEMNFSRCARRIKFHGAQTASAAKKIYDMKHYLSMALAVACTALVISLVVMKRGDDAQHENDTGSIADFSNRLDSAQIQIATCTGKILTYSNTLDESRSASLTFSNRLVEAESTIALDAEQITNLNRQIAESASQNQSLSRRIMDLTDQLAGLTGQIALAGTNLD
jgi:uncharacterized coiled-coil protein SlyX